MHKKKNPFFWNLILGFILITPKNIFSQKNTKRIHILAHKFLSPAMKMEKVEDYSPGENDFPITPSHIELDSGIFLIREFWEKPKKPGPFVLCV